MPLPAHPDLDAAERARLAELLLHPDPDVRRQAIELALIRPDGCALVTDALQGAAEWAELLAFVEQHRPSLVRPYVDRGSLRATVHRLLQGWADLMAGRPEAVAALHRVDQSLAAEAALQALADDWRPAADPTAIMLLHPVRVVLRRWCPGARLVVELPPKETAPS